MEDLYYRLERFLIQLPDHREDIPALCTHFARQLCPDRSVTFDPALLQDFMRRPWPGNVRELRNEVERRLLLNPGETVIGLDQGAATSTGIVLEESPKASAAPAPILALPRNPRQRRRRRAVLRLFDAHPQVYRADVVDHCGCAPATAAKDLQILGDLGLIEHVTTSANPRTAYWRRCAQDETASAQMP